MRFNEHAGRARGWASRKGDETATMEVRLPLELYIVDKQWNKPELAETASCTIWRLGRVTRSVQKRVYYRNPQQTWRLSGAERVAV